jgi:hypothetical protein
MFPDYKLMMSKRIDSIGKDMATAEGSALARGTAMAEGSASARDTASAKGMSFQNEGKLTPPYALRTLNSTFLQ